MTIRALFLVLVGLGFTATELIASDPLEDLLAATFRIADREYSGTGFFVSGHAVNSANPRDAILVTAAHVLDQMPRSECELILRSKVEDHQFARKIVPIRIRDGDQPKWSRIPDVDIAAMLIELPEGVSVTQIPFEQIADEQNLKDRSVRVGQETWIACFPAKLEANEAGWPILRKGSIASYPLHPVKSNRTMLVDYNVFGGDSGAPVAVVLNDRPVIVGVESGLHRQTDRSTLPFEERIMHTPLGLSIVVQAALLRDTIKLISVK